VAEMTKKDIIKFLEPFDDEIEIRVNPDGLIFPAKAKYMPTTFADDYAYVLIMEDR
jgi:hypothetical protein